MRSDERLQQPLIVRAKQRNRAIPAKLRSTTHRLGSSPQPRFASGSRTSSRRILINWEAEDGA
jgi:hypothetical protein